MSKSLPAGCVSLLDPPKQIAKKIKSAVTDSETEVRYDPEHKPGVSNLLTLLSAFTGESIPALEQRYAGSMYGPLKAEVADVVADFATRYAERTRSLLADPATLDQVMASGAERARQVAAETLRLVYERVGFVPLTPAG